MSLLEFNKVAEEFYTDGRNYDLDSYLAITNFKQDYFKNCTLEDMFELFNFKRFKIRDIKEEFGMEVNELQEHATILFIDDNFALVNVDY